MSMDALTRVMDVLRLKPTIFHRLKFAEPWGMRLSASNTVAFHVVEYGICWLHFDGDRAPIKLESGDLIVVSNMPRYEITDNVTHQSLPVVDLPPLKDRDGIISFGDRAKGQKTTLLCGEFQSEYEAIYPLFTVLPHLLHIRGKDGQAVDWLKIPIEQIAIEVQNNYPGRDTVISRIMDVLFIMVIRYWVVYQSHEDGGLFSALYHPEIGKVLGVIHQHPEMEWTVDALATEVNLSRSSLAMKFSALVGEAPMKYLTRWRMQLATMWLINQPELTIEDIAQRVGYSSAYAFSKAFKRLLGVPPSNYRRMYSPLQ